MVLVRFRLGTLETPRDEPEKLEGSKSLPASAPTPTPSSSCAFGPKAEKKTMFRSNNYCK